MYYLHNWNSVKLFQKFLKDLVIFEDKKSSIMLSIEHMGWGIIETLTESLQKKKIIENP